MASKNNQFVLTVDLKAKYLVDGFLLIQDLYSGYSYQHTNTNEYFQNYSMLVGNSTDWRKNPSCPGGPYMTIAKDDSPESGWIYDGFA